MNKIEYNTSLNPTDEELGIIQGAPMIITPAITPEFWLFRVKVYKNQAILGFPKFGTIGIGFALEKGSWNTNLPYTCTPDELYAHIKENKYYHRITEKQCLEAIKAVQEAAKLYMAKQKGREEAK